MLGHCTLAKVVRFSWLFRALLLPCDATNNNRNNSIILITPEMLNKADQDKTCLSTAHL